ncbi:MAG TPA: MlaD family protein [Burkholderiaceae bacterium]|nr:MlaD family protein [Burkholderiaceae bacterium]
MAEPTSSRPTDGLPEAVVQTSGRFRPQLVWVIPIVAALIGGWLAVKTVLERGPTITISFLTAQGIEAGKTKVKYKNVDIGEVRTVTLSEDGTRIIATAEFTKDAAKFLVKDTRFWVVRPRVGAGGISGLGTLFSGAYLGMDVGKSKETRHDFVGLEVPPVVTAEVPGRQFVLHSDDIGSLDVGSPVYFRRIQVGQVVAFDLDADGQGVTLKVFINSPYEKYVTRDTRFWHASGVDMTLDANGIRVRTESVASIVSGGIAFEAGPDVTQATPAPEDANFDLAADRAQAMTTPERIRKQFLLYFDESLRGLSPGAPVDFSGLTVGEVTGISLEYDARLKRLRFPVSIDVFPDRLRARFRKGANVKAQDLPGAEGQLLDELVRSGYRAQLRTGNLVTGQLYIAFDRFSNVPAARVDRSTTPPILPTTPGNLQQLQLTLAKIADKLDKVPLEQLVNDARDALEALDRALNSTDRLVKRIDGEIAPDLQAVLNSSRQTLDAARQTLGSSSPEMAEVRETLGELRRAAEAVRVLAEMLEKNPESLIRGKKEEKP